jgi:branched-chain amino acid aminotransferase
VPVIAAVDGVLAERPVVDATDPGLLRGDGAFEVVRLYGGRPFALEEHLERLGRSCAGLRLPCDLAAVRADAQTVLEAAGPADGVLRLVLTRGGRRLAFVEPLPERPPTVRLASVTFAPTRLMDGIKSLSYAGNMLATRLAAEQGADEALLVTPHGRALEAPTSSLFVAFDERTLVTPPLDDHILDSITRRAVLGLVACEERPVALDDLRGAREAFLASTTREVQPVAAIDGRALPAAPGPLTAAAAAALSAHVRERVS